MPDKKEETKKEEPKKGFFGKLKDHAEDKEEQMMLLSTFVRLGILIWSGGILTLAYVDLPPAFKIPKQDLDPTFIASVFTGVLASFGIQTASKKGDGTMKMNGNGNGAVGGGNGNGGPVQTLRIEQAPLKIIAVDPGKKDEKPYTL